MLLKKKKEKEKILHFVKSDSKKFLMTELNKADKDSIELAELRSRLTDVRQINAQNLAKIAELEDQIVQKKDSLQYAKNELTIISSKTDAMSVAPKLFENEKLEKIDLLPEHELILINRQKAMNAKVETIMKNEGTNEKLGIIGNLRKEYAQLLQEEANWNKKLNNAHYQLQQWNVLQKSTSDHLNFLNEQIKDYKREYIQMNQLLTKAKKAHDELSSRKNVAIDDQKNVLSKNIRSKENQIIEIQKQITDIRKFSHNLRQHSDALDYQQRLTEAEEKSKADWSLERENLQNELAALKRDLQEKRKEHISKDNSKMDQIREMKESLSQSSQEKYGYILRAWAGKEMEIQADDEISQSGDMRLRDMWEEVNEYREQLAVLMKENAQKERKLEKMKKSLDRQIQMFREDELRGQKEAVEYEEQFKRAEEKLLKKIKATKIMIAQNKFKNGKM